ncbi:TTN [Symbiodinium sp. CCMP2456]|nr:TTN [Symbiodinium sp. CCMP2456]
MSRPRRQVRGLSAGLPAQAPSREIVDAVASREASLRRLQRLAGDFAEGRLEASEAQRELVDSLLHCRALSLDVVEAFEKWPKWSKSFAPGLLQGDISVEDDFQEVFGPSTSPNKSFRSGGWDLGGGWSFPAVQSDEAQYSGWGVPPSTSHYSAREDDYMPEGRRLADPEPRNGWGLPDDLDAGPGSALRWFVTAAAVQHQLMPAYLPQERYVASCPRPSAMTPQISYPAGCNVNVQELSTSVGLSCGVQRRQLAQQIESGHRAAMICKMRAARRVRTFAWALDVRLTLGGDVLRNTLEIYRACDRSASGNLQWANGEIQDGVCECAWQYRLQEFISLVFQQHGLPPPSPTDMYQLFLRFDEDRNSVLDARECVCMVDALPSGFVPALPSNLSVPSTRPVLSRGPSVVVSTEGRPRTPSPRFLDPQGYAPSRLNPVTLQASSVPVLQPRPGQAPGVSLRPAAQSIRSMPMMPQSMPVMPNSVPQDGEEDHLLIPHRIEDMGDGVSRRPPQNQQKPPAWHAIEERPHLLEVELQELELHPDAPDLQPGMFESLKYFVSLHPRSEEPDHIPLPRDAPLQTVDGHYIVSQAQRAAKPGLQVGIFAGDDDERPNQNPVEPFSLRMEKLDHHLVAYVWATKGTLLATPVTTPRHVGSVPANFKGHRVAEMRLKYHVCTTPAAVTDMAMADVKQTEVTVKWSPPKNDHGAPIIGYKISILLDPQPNELPEWYTLCECTKSLNPLYVVANLRGNTAYLLDVRAVNKVGAGDAGEFEIVTAPIPPDPPSKPWIEEARDGCLNVAWTPPRGDGPGGREGSAGTLELGLVDLAVRVVKMLKVCVLLAYAPTGTHSDQEKQLRAGWMGSVGAATGQEDASMYNAWVGPLELGACEYRFQVTALNKLGESKACCTSALLVSVT